MPALVRTVQVRFSAEEVEDLQRMGAIQKAPVSSVVRACTRHFILEWRAGRPVTAQLGSVTWEGRR